MYLSIKHVWMYFVKTNCNDMKGGRLLVYIDFFVAQSKQKNEAEKSLRMKSFCMHQYAFAFPRQPLLTPGGNMYCTENRCDG